MALGPGSFNGVRVALSSAKALAFSLQKPLLGIGTLDVLAANSNSGVDRSVRCWKLAALNCMLAVIFPLRPGIRMVR
ncbi:hypothetical protein [Dictyobacter formicarum]|uniref:hypothetical protein n=1 Tax=Dictyobacter formicarum TaxID=2778368 RepID=UPI0019166FB2